MLYDYLKRVQILVGYDQNETFYNIEDLTAFINTARQEVAAQGQCIRLLTPCQGSILTLTVTKGGHGYTAPTLSISVPDAPSGSLPYPSGAQATGTLQQIGGVLTNASVNFGGGGYFAPNVTISDPTGTGGAVTAQVSPLNQALYSQEEYQFAGINLTPFPGIGAILAVRSVSFIWNQWQWTASRVSFSKYQALIRQYVSTFFAPPVWLCQFGQGVAGSIKIYPLPDQSYQMQWDVSCLPLDLVDDTSYEAIPDPWRVAVPYYAAHIALLGRAAEIPQLLPLAQSYFNEKTGGLFGTHMRRARAFSQPGVPSSAYGRV